MILGVILLFDVIELIRRAAGRTELDFWLLLGMALLKLPQMMHTILPFAVMIGAMVCFWRLTRTHELVVVRSAGISAWQFLAPLCFGSLLIAQSIRQLERTTNYHWRPEGVAFRITAPLEHLKG